MRWRIIRSLYSSELTAMLRDRKAMAAMLLLPALLYPTLVLGFGQILLHRLATARQTVSKVAVWGMLPPAAAAALERQASLDLTLRPAPAAATFEVVPATPVTGSPLLQDAFSGQRRPTAKVSSELLDEAAGLIQTGQADAVLLVHAAFAAQLAGSATAKAAILFDETRSRSSLAAQRLERRLGELSKAVLGDRMAAHPELSDGFITPVLVAEHNIGARPGDRLAGLVLRALPAVAILVLLLGSFHPAIDLTAGEKEHGTLHALLAAPIRPGEILAAKVTVVLAVALLAAAAHAAAAFLTTTCMLGADLSAVAGALPRSVLWWLGGVLQFVAVAFVLAALALSVAAYTDSFQEAQNYLAPVCLVVIVPVFLTALHEPRLSVGTACVPIVSTALWFRHSMHATPGVLLSAVAALSNVAAGVLLLRGATRSFGSGGAPARPRRAPHCSLGLPASRLTPGTALVAFAAVFAANAYLGTWLQRQHLTAGLLFSQCGLFLGGTLLGVRLLRLDGRTALGLRRPVARGALAAVLMGCSSWLVLGVLTRAAQQLILPEPAAVTESMEAALGLSNGDVPLIWLLAAFALTPAVCEELFFRGFMLAGLRSGMSKWPAILMTSVCFGLSHVSLYRVFPTAVIGVAAALIVWHTRSILPGILFHFLHNATSILVLRSDWAESLAAPDRARWWLIGVPLGAAFAVGAWLLRPAQKL